MAYIATKFIFLLFFWIQRKSYPCTWLWGMSGMVGGIGVKIFNGALEDGIAQFAWKSAMLHAIKVYSRLR